MSKEKEYRLSLMHLRDRIESLQTQIKLQLEEFQEETGLQVQHITVYGRPDGEVGNVIVSVGLEEGG